MTSTTATVPNPATSRKPTDEEVDVYGLTHPGRVRKENQDHFVICSLHKEVVVHKTSLPDTDVLTEGPERLAFLAMVADGVGGGLKGEEASRLALESITRYVTDSVRCYYTCDPSDDSSFLEKLETAALQAHDDLLRRSTDDPDRSGLATTLTSRTDAANTRLAHTLSSSIGGRQSAPVVTRMLSEWGNVGMLCSDGLTRHVSDDRIRERLASMTSAKQVCEALLQDALDGGGTDNITIIVGRPVRRGAA
jgi:serine/threonine protein phosphatase PrpC